MHRGQTAKCLDLRLQSLLYVLGAIASRQNLPDWRRTVGENRRHGTVRRVSRKMPSARWREAVRIWYPIAVELRVNGGDTLKTKSSPFEAGKGYGVQKMQTVDNCMTNFVPDTSSSISVEKHFCTSLKMG
jgi:hypothetical protein